MRCDQHSAHFPHGNDHVLRAVLYQKQGRVPNRPQGFQLPADDSFDFRQIGLDEKRFFLDAMQKGFPGAVQHAPFAFQHFQATLVGGFLAAFGQAPAQHHIVALLGLFFQQGQEIFQLALIH